MILSKANLKNINAPGVVVPDEQLFNLPEKVLQFGTGVLLRGLPDYFIDKANRQGLFNGRVVVVKSTDSGSADEFEKQDGLYTLHIKGIDAGQQVDEQIINSSISRVLSAGKQWDEILAFAKSPGLQVVISNTTEVGIQLTQDDVNAQPPVSYPGKLLAVLHERYKAFSGSNESGLVIVPTELIVDNGKKLKSIVLELARQNNLEPAFIDWVNNYNHFCSSLVDRIVPGKPNTTVNQEFSAESGYQDDLRIVSEVYSLWAIEGDENISSILTFAQADKGVVITPDIERFRELKLRLLNATHTLCCAVAFLSGFDTVKEAMGDKDFENFITRLMLNDIAPAIPYQITTAEKADFAAKVLDRFRNPSIEHKWISISVQYTSKIKLRVLPLLQQHYQNTNEVPQFMALGLAAYIRFMQTESVDGKFTGNANGATYTVTDDKNELFSSLYNGHDNQQVVKSILSNQLLWDTDLTLLPGLKTAALNHLNAIDTNGAKTVIAGI